MRGRKTTESYGKIAPSLLQSGITIQEKSGNQYYGFGLNLDTYDSNAYVSRAKRTRCYAETATFPRANFLERK